LSALTEKVPYEETTMKRTGLTRFALPALLALFLGACTIGQKHGAAETYVTDTTITTNVKAALFQATDPGTADIHVQTCHGIVQLSGPVLQAAQIQKAIAIAKEVEGVKEVKSSLNQQP
jgi:hyperosmotically inducible protein